jgi:zinc transporter ZupT
VNTLVWIVQIVLALGFGMAGVMKVSQPRERLAKQMGWVNDFAPSTVRLIGVLELLGAIGLILPAATKVLPWLTPVAAGGLVLTMVGAMITHLRRHEASQISVNLVLLALAAFVVIGRAVSVPFA